MRSHRFIATLLLVVLGAAPLALAQQAKPSPKKKGAKPSASASASASTASPVASDTAPDPTPAPEPAAPAQGRAGPEAPAASAKGPPPGDDVQEDPHERYYFLGARYRGTLLPQFLMNLFVNDGATVYSNSAGIELDMRSEGHSTIPWIAYADYHTGDILFLQQGKADDPSNYSDVKSSLGAVYLGLDELWSVPLDDGHRWEFEYGFGLGLGVVFGTLNNDWVYQDPSGSLAGANGNHYTQCSSTAQPPVAQPNGENPCISTFHSNASVNKVGGYVEPNWFSGGSTPVIFPHIAVPQLSLRYKAARDVEARLSAGFSILGFWFGLSVDYGVGQSTRAPEPDKNDKTDKPLDPATSEKTTSGQPTLRGML